jgi:hypothetical protein
LILAPNAEWSKHNNNNNNNNRPPTRRLQLSGRYFIACNVCVLKCLLLLLSGGQGRGDLEVGRGRLLAGANLLPGGGRVGKVAERLGELEGLVDDALLLLVVADLGVALEMLMGSGVMMGSRGRLTVRGKSFLRGWPSKP